MAETLRADITGLRDKDHHARGRAALALGKLGDKRAGEPLIRALCAELDPFVRENISWALARLGPRVVTALIALLGHSEPSYRRRAAHVLSKVGDPRGVSALIEALSDQDSTVTAKCVFALGQLSDRRAISPLAQLIGHDSTDVEATLASVLEQFGSAAVTPVVERLTSESARVRARAAHILGRLGSADAVPALIGALRDENWEVRFASVQALGDLGGESPRDALQSMRDDPDVRVRSLVERYPGARGSQAEKAGVRPT